jgi:PAS domain S-box-containing protein
MNAAFAHRSSMHASMLSVVAGISEALTLRHSVDGALPDILASLLEASGVSRGALFTLGAPPGGATVDLLLGAQVGFSALVEPDLRAFFGNRELFDRAVATRAPVVVGGAAEDAAGVELLTRAGAQSALLVPFVAGQDCLGILLLASTTRDLTEGDWIPFARALAVQIGQALSLSRAFSMLAASDSRYRLLVQGAADGIFVLDRQGHFREVNPAMARFLGRPSSEILGAHVSVFVAAEEHESSRRGFAQTLEQGRFQVDARRFVRPDGSVVIGELSATTVDVQGGLVQGILRDVTEKHRSEDEVRLLHGVALAASEAPNQVAALQVVLQKICETNGWRVGAAWVPQPSTGALACVCLWTRDAADRARMKVLGEPVFVAGEGVLGRARAAKKPLWVPDLAAEPGCARSRRAAELGVHACIAVPVVASDEVIAVIEFFVDQVRAEDRRSVSLVLAACAQLGSILARKRTEEALRASEVRFARLAESGLIGITVADVLGKIHDANDAYLRMVGYSRQEVVDGTARWDDLAPPEFEDETASAMARLKETGVALPWETETFRKDGTRVPILVGAAMLDPLNCISFTVDLTERKRAEEALRKTEAQLRQAQKMEAVGRLAGGVAHDFNNVLSVILSYAEMIHGDLEPGDPMRADIEEIASAGKRAAALTRQPLMFSRQQVIAPRVLDLDELLGGMSKMLQRMVGEDVELVYVPNPSPGRVDVDPGGMEQLVMNLVVNARDAMPTGGKITIETRSLVLDDDHARVHVGASAGPHVLLAVSDTGIGMDAETQARIFEPFFTTKSKDKGTGLGLSTVYGIVQQSGGTISVYSEPGKGTCFKVYLPSAEAALDEAPTTATAAPAGGSETILLVEDEEPVRAVAHAILRKEGYRVLVAANGGAALLLCEAESGPIHLLLTDVVMPQMSGPELAKRLAKVRPEMKLLCTSGYTDDSIVRHGVLESEIAFLQKPITPQTLSKRVREVLDAPRRPS